MPRAVLQVATSVSVAASTTLRGAPTTTIAPPAGTGPSLMSRAVTPPATVWIVPFTSVVKMFAQLTSISVTTFAAATVMSVTGVTPTFAVTARLKREAIQCPSAMA